MRSFVPAILLIVSVGSPAFAQDALSLQQAVARARSANPSARAAAAGVEASNARVAESRASWWPRVDASETVQRGNLPVYAFSTLLSQRRFSEADFAIATLNHPDPLTNHRAAVTVQHALFDSGRGVGTRTARLASDIARETERSVGHDIAAGAAAAFAAALAADSEVRAARAAVDAAEEDLRRAAERRDAGLATDADVLEMRVHLARSRAALIDGESGSAVAQAALDEVMGEPLDRRYVLVAPADAGSQRLDLESLERDAIASHPDLRRAELEARTAGVEQAGARAALLPQVGWQAGYEWNGDSFGTRAGGWIVGADVRLNLFKGFADRARIAAGTASVKRAEADRAAALARVRLVGRSAATRLDSARARVEVAATAVEQAREGQRIVRDRYENGMAGIGDVLRAAQAVLEAERLQAGAHAAVITESARLDRAVGR
jgi:outer membrane protein TolC